MTPHEPEGRDIMMDAQLEKVRDDILKSLTKLERAALFYDYKQFVECWIEEQDYNYVTSHFEDDR